MKVTTLKVSALVFAALAAGANARVLAQNAQGGAATGSSTAASADRNGASVSNSDSSSAAAKTKHANANLAGSSEMSATLTKPVDARKAKPGDEVTARSDKDVTTSDGTTIKRGSKLIGHVTQAQPKSAGGNAGGNAGAGSALGIVFDKAVLKDGHEVPLNSTIQAISATQSESAMSDDAGAAMSAGGSGAGMARGTGGGMLGGVTGSATGAVGAAGGLGHHAVGATDAVGGVAALGTRSAGAVGGLNAAGDLAAGSKGVFGLKDMNLTSAAEGNAEGSLITSPTRNVRLDGGTKLLLSSTASASGAAEKSAGAADKSGTADKSSRADRPSPGENRK